jgi:hypothetical protein
MQFPSPEFCISSTGSLAASATPAHSPTPSSSRVTGTCRTRPSLRNSSRSPPSVLQGTETKKSAPASTSVSSTSRGSFDTAITGVCTSPVYPLFRRGEEYCPPKSPTVRRLFSPTRAIPPRRGRGIVSVYEITRRGGATTMWQIIMMIAHLCFAHGE